MDWLQFVLLIISLAGIDFVSKKSIKEEIRAIKQKSDDDSRNIVNLVIAIKDDIKDFHGRLCAIEERKNQIKSQ